MVDEDHNHSGVAVRPGATAPPSAYSRRPLLGGDDAPSNTTATPQAPLAELLPEPAPSATPRATSSQSRRPGVDAAFEVGPARQPAETPGAEPPEYGELLDELDALARAPLAAGELDPSLLLEVGSLGWGATHEDAADAMQTQPLSGPSSAQRAQSTLPVLDDPVRLLQSPPQQPVGSLPPEELLVDAAAQLAADDPLLLGPSLSEDAVQTETGGGLAWAEAAAEELLVAMVESEAPPADLKLHLEPPAPAMSAVALAEAARDAPLAAEEYAPGEAWRMLAERAADFPMEGVAGVARSSAARASAPTAASSEDPQLLQLDSALEAEMLAVLADAASMPLLSVPSEVLVMQANTLPGARGAFEDDDDEGEDGAAASPLVPDAPPTLVVDVPAEESAAPEGAGRGGRHEPAWASGAQAARSTSSASGGVMSPANGSSAPAGAADDTELLVSDDAMPVPSLALRAMLLPATSVAATLPAAAAGTTAWFAVPGEPATFAPTLPGVEGAIDPAAATESGLAPVSFAAWENEAPTALPETIPGPHGIDRGIDATAAAALMASPLAALPSVRPMGSLAPPFDLQPDALPAGQLLARLPAPLALSSSTAGEVPRVEHPPRERRAAPGAHEAGLAQAEGGAAQLAGVAGLADVDGHASVGGGLDGVGGGLDGVGGGLDGVGGGLDGAGSFLLAFDGDVPMLQPAAWPLHPRENLLLGGGGEGAAPPIAPVSPIPVVAEPHYMIDQMVEELPLVTPPLPRRTDTDALQLPPLQLPPISPMQLQPGRLPPLALPLFDERAVPSLQLTSSGFGSLGFGSLYKLDTQLAILPPFGRTIAAGATDDGLPITLPHVLQADALLPQQLPPLALPLLEQGAVGSLQLTSAAPMSGFGSLYQLGMQQALLPPIAVGALDELPLFTPPSPRVPMLDGGDHPLYDHKTGLLPLLVDTPDGRAPLSGLGSYTSLMSHADLAILPPFGGGLAPLGTYADIATMPAITIDDLDDVLATSPDAMRLELDDWLARGHLDANDRLVAAGQRPAGQQVAGALDESSFTSLAASSLPGSLVGLVPTGGEDVLLMPHLDDWGQLEPFDLPEPIMGIGLGAEGTSLSSLSSLPSSFAELAPPAADRLPPTFERLIEVASLPEVALPHDDQLGLVMDKFPDQAFAGSALGSLPGSMAASFANDDVTLAPDFIDLTGIDFAGVGLELPADAATSMAGSSMAGSFSSSMALPAIAPTDEPLGLALMPGAEIDQLLDSLHQATLWSSEDGELGAPSLAAASSMAGLDGDELNGDDHAITIGGLTVGGLPLATLPIPTLRSEEWSAIGKMRKDPAAETDAAAPRTFDFDQLGAPELLRPTELRAGLFDLTQLETTSMDSSMPLNAAGSMASSFAEMPIPVLPGLHDITFDLPPLEAQAAWPTLPTWMQPALSMGSSMPFDGANSMPNSFAPMGAAVLPGLRDIQLDLQPPLGAQLPAARPAFARASEGERERRELENDTAFARATEGERERRELYKYATFAGERERRELYKDTGADGMHGADELFLQTAGFVDPAQLPDVLPHIDDLAATTSFPGSWAMLYGISVRLADTIFCSSDPNHSHSHSASPLPLCLFRPSICSALQSRLPCITYTVPMRFAFALARRRPCHTWAQWTLLSSFQLRSPPWCQCRFCRTLLSARSLPSPWTLSSTCLQHHRLLSCQSARPQRLRHLSHPPLLLRQCRHRHRFRCGHRFNARQSLHTLHLPHPRHHPRPLLRHLPRPPVRHHPRSPVRHHLRPPVRHHPRSPVHHLPRPPVRHPLRQAHHQVPRVRGFRRTRR